MSERLQAWRERFAPREITLSTGLTILIKPVSIEALVFRGVIPMTLMYEVSDARKSQKRKGGRPTIDEDILTMLPSINAVVMAAAVDPPVTEDGGDDSISLDALSLIDRMAIFEEANSAAVALRPFRPEPRGDVDPAPDSEDLREATE